MLVSGGRLVVVVDVVVVVVVGSASVQKTYNNIREIANGWIIFD